MQFVKKRFRQCFIYFLELFAQEIYNSNTGLEQLIENHIKSINTMCNQLNYPIDFSSLYGIMKKVLQVESVFGQQSEQRVQELANRFNQQFRREEVRTGYIGDQFEIIMNRSINRLLRIQAETSNRSQEFMQFEDKFLFGSKDVYGNMNDARMFLKRISHGFNDYMAWYMMVYQKSRILCDYVKDIREQKYKNELFSHLESTMVREPQKFLQGKLKEFGEFLTGQDKEVLQKIISRMILEQKVSMYTRDYIRKIIVNLDRPNKDNYMRASEQLKLYIKIMEESTDLGSETEQFFYHPIHLQLQLQFGLQIIQTQNDDYKKLISYLSDMIEKFRFFTLMFMLSDQEQNIQNIIQSTQTIIPNQNSGIPESTFNKLSIDTQYTMVQKFYNYCAEYCNCQKSQKVFIWKDSFPLPRFTPETKLKPHLANNRNFNLSCFLIQIILYLRGDQKIIIMIDQLSKDLSTLSEVIAKNQAFELEDFKKLSLLDQQPKFLEIVQKGYYDVVKLKEALTQESIKFEIENPSLAEQYQRALFDIFSKTFSKIAIIDQCNKKKLELKIPLSREEILQEIRVFFNRKIQANNSLPNVPDKQERQKSMEESFSKLQTEVKNSIKDGQDLVNSLKQILEQQKSSNMPFMKEFNSEFIAYLLKMIPPILVRPTPVRRNNQYVNEQAILKRMEKYKNLTPQEQNLSEIFAEKFVIFMKDFMSKILKVAVVQNAGDEIKIFQTQLLTNRHKAVLENDRNHENLVKQITDLYNIYGPNKESDIDTTLLITQTQIPIRQVQYSLCDMTPQTRQTDFAKFINFYDQSQEEMLKQQLKTDKWRTSRPELNDILSKKIKRGTDIGNALQEYYRKRITDESRDEEQITQNESSQQEQCEKIKSNILESVKQTMYNQSTSQMWTKLKNFESNNHLLKKKAISVKTVQFVIEDMQMFRKSKTLMKSYLF